MHLRLQAAPTARLPRLVVAEDAGQVLVLDARHEREEDQRVVHVVRDRVDRIRALLLGLERLGHARVVKPDIALGGVLGQLLGSEHGEVEEAVRLARDVPLPLLLGR